MTEPRLSQAKVKKPVQKKNEKKRKSSKVTLQRNFCSRSIHTHQADRQTERQTDKQAIRKSHYRIQTKGLIERRITHKGNNKHKHTKIQIDRHLSDREKTTLS
jgi:hypothetical protein